jgi:Zn-dependent protease
MNSDILALIPLWYVAFLFSTVCHEAAHALVAKWGGDLTAYAGGQVTLDPVPHIRREPFGLLVIPLVTLLTSNGGSMFGWGTAPINPYWQIRHPRRAALMSLAGPVTNYLLAILAAMCMYGGLVQGAFEFPTGGASTQIVSAVGQSGVMEGFATFLSIMFILNVVLGTFNLIPIPPLDGYSVLGLVLPEDVTLRLLAFARSPGFSIVGILLAFQLFPYIATPVLRFAVRLFYSLLL